MSDLVRTAHLTRLTTEIDQHLRCLTLKQRRYVEARAEGLTQVASARSAGYSTPDQQAPAVEAHPAVRTALDAIRKVSSFRAQLTKEDVVEGLLDAVDSAGSSQDLVSAWREIGKVIGAYEPAKVEIKDVSKSMTMQDLQTLSTEDLVKLAELKTIDIEPEDESEYASHTEFVAEAIRSEGTSSYD